MEEARIGEGQRTASFRCAARKPDGPGAEPGGKLLIECSTKDSGTVMGAGTGSGGRGGGGD